MNPTKIILTKFLMLALAGAAGTLDIEHMDQLMDGFSALRRLLKQAYKAAALLSTLTPVPSDNGHNGDNGVEAATGAKNGG